MSKETIIDGTGRGFLAKVDNTNKLQTRSSNVTSLEEASINGDAYSVSTGQITLTSDSSSAVYFFKNQEDVDVVLTRSIYGAGTSTGGANQVYTIQSHINATGIGSGTGNDMNQQNLRFGSGRVMTLSDSEIGAEGATITGGTALPTFQLATGVSSFITTFIVIPKDVTLSVTVEPPSGNTSMTIEVILNLHLLRAT